MSRGTGTSAEILYGHLYDRQSTRPAAADRPWWWPLDGNIDFRALDFDRQHFDQHLVGGWLWSGSETGWSVRAPLLPDIWKKGGTAKCHEGMQQYLEAISQLENVTKKTNTIKILDNYDQRYLKIEVLQDRHDFNPYEGAIVNLYQMMAVQKLASEDGKWRFLDLQTRGEIYEELVYVNAKDQIIGSVAVNNQNAIG